MFNKTKVFNLALQALFINKRITNADTDNSTEAHALRTNWDFIYPQALSELDLDSTSITKTLELVVEKPNTKWLYAYKYPNDVALIRRIDNCHVTDDIDTVVKHRVELYEYNGDIIKVIMTNKHNSEVEYISTDVPVDTLTAEAAQFIALVLARASISLIVGERQSTVDQSVASKLVQAHVAARRKDGIETQVSEPAWKQSSFVKARMS